MTNSRTLYDTTKILKTVIESMFVGKRLSFEEEHRFADLSGRGRIGGGVRKWIDYGQLTDTVI